MMRLLTAAVLLGSIAGAQSSGDANTPPAEHSFSQPCDALRPAALMYFQKESLPLAATAACTDCFAGTTRKLHDEAGHRLLSNRNVIGQFTTYHLNYERPGPLSQIVHTNLRTEAKLRLRPEGSGCRAALDFHFSWYGAQLVLGFPVDGDGAGAYSNGKLEAAYLAALQTQLDHAAVAKR